MRQKKLKLLLSLATLLVVGGFVCKQSLNHVQVRQEAAQAQSVTQNYIHNFDPEQYMRAGTDFFNPRYSPLRLNKPLDQIDRTYDYPFQHLEKIENRLKHVDRRTALKGIFEKITCGAQSDHERHLAVLNFLYRAAYHNAFVQPMYEDKQAVFDPLVLLELGEMRCGAVARVAADLFDAAGYRTRLVQAYAHTTAEINYDGGWHLFEADLAGGPPVIFEGRIPSVEELAQSPFLIDKAPPNFEEFVAPRQADEEKSPIYRSYFFSPKKLSVVLKRPITTRPLRLKRPPIQNGMAGTIT